jgi:phosphoglycolate phosphatase
MRRAGVIFDLDGVLADSREAIVGSFRAALIARGHAAPSDERLAACIGPPPFVAISDLLGLAPDDAEVAAVVAAYREDYGPTYLERTGLFPGIVDAVTVLSRSHRIAVATSKPHRYAEPLVERLGLGELIEHVAGPRGDKHQSSKSAEVAEAHAAVGAGPAVMIGDRRFDIEAGIENGLSTIGVLWGIGDRAELSGAGADVLIERPEELHEAIAGLLAAPG